MFFSFGTAEHIEMARLLGQISGESNWAEIGSVLVELEKQGSVDSQGVPWAQHVLNRLENLNRTIEAQQLRKIRRSYLFLRDKMKTNPTNYRDCPISGIDIIARIFEINKERAREELEKLQGGMPFAETMRTYEELRSSAASARTQALAVRPRQRSHPRARQEIVKKEIVDWLEKQPTAFFGEDVTRFFMVSRDPQGKYQKANLVFRFVTANADDVNKYAAFEIKQIGMIAARDRKAVVAEVSVIASFYDMFWFILADVQDGHEISADLVSLGLRNVGLALLTADGKREVVRPPSGLPFPDRRAMLTF